MQQTPLYTQPSQYQPAKKKDHTEWRILAGALFSAGMIAYFIALSAASGVMQLANGSYGALSILQNLQSVLNNIGVFFVASAVGQGFMLMGIIIAVFSLKE